MTTKWSIALRRNLVFGYLAEPEDKRLSLVKFLKSHRIQKRTFYLLEGEYRATNVNISKQEKEEHKQQLRATVMDTWDRLDGKEPPRRTSNGAEIVEVSEDERVALERKVYDDAIKTEATKGDKELAIRMLGMLIDKKEVIIGLTADDIARRNLGADRELEQWRLEQGGEG